MTYDIIFLISSLVFYAQFEAKQNAEREERLAEPAKLRKNFEKAHPDETFRNELGLYAVGMVMKHRRYHYHCVSP